MEHSKPQSFKRSTILQELNRCFFTDTDAEGILAKIGVLAKIPIFQCDKHLNSILTLFLLVAFHPG